MAKTFTLLLSLVIFSFVAVQAEGIPLRHGGTIMEVKVFPNPSNDGNFSIEVNNLMEDEEINIVVYNLIGKKVHQIKLQHKNGQFHQSVQLGHLAKGFYMLQVTRGEEKVTKRLSYR